MRALKMEIGVLLRAMSRFGGIGNEEKGEEEEMVVMERGKRRWEMNKLESVKHKSS